MVQKLNRNKSLSKKEYNKQWRKNNAEKIKEYNKQYRIEYPEVTKEWRKNNLEKVKEYNRYWRKNNTEKIEIYIKRWKMKNPRKRGILDKNNTISNLKKGKEKDTLWRRNNPDKRKDYRLKTHYNITLEEYDKMYNKQRGKCMICGVHQSEIKKGLHVDHNHITGEVRGLLCFSCNSLLGNANENISILNNAILYLNQH